MSALDVALLIAAAVLAEDADEAAVVSGMAMKKKSPLACIHGRRLK
jgi:hypothetical protein